MDFQLTPEHKMLKEMAEKFARNEFTPVSQQCDREEEYTRDIVRKAAEIGLVGAWVPEAYGGGGVGQVGNCIISEEFSRVDMGIGGNIISAAFGCEAIYRYGSEEQKSTYLTSVCQGRMISAGAFTEPDAGTDVTGFRTRAIKDNREYVINGNKMFITNGTVCDFFVTLCVTNPEAKRHRRFSLIIIPADRPGIARTKIRGKMGIRAGDTAEISFEDVRVPLEYRIGEEGRGFYQLMNLFDSSRPLVAAQALGLSEACLEASVRYGNQRTAFGAPIGTFQLTQAKLMEMATRIEALRGLVYRSAWLIDAGQPDYTLAAMAKYFGGQTAVFCANAAVEIHGGYGYIDEFAVQKYYRDAKILELYEGTKEAEILTLGRSLLGL